jgi:hypothetical protein
MKPTLEDLARLGIDMRDMQRRYFDGNRSSAVLSEAKKLERRFDKACLAALEPAGLFNEKEAEAR